MSETGDEKQQGRRRGNSNEKELASQQIQIQSKRFYIDVKENQRGRFIKLAEVGVGGRKSRILMTMSAATEFKNRLVEFSELHSQMGPSQGGATNAGATNAAPSASGASAPAAASAGSANGADNRENDGLIKSETFIKDRKRYYLDLKENQRGRFLRVSMVVPGPRGARTQVAIPAQGLIEFKDQLADMLERYSTASEETSQADLPESKSLRADNKTFYFDCGSNQRGIFLKISEVRQNRYRTSITIPEKYLKQFKDQINEFIEKSAAGEIVAAATSTGPSETPAVTAPVAATTPAVAAPPAAATTTEAAPAAVVADKQPAAKSENTEPKK